MDRKIVALCILLGIIIENAEARHLSGGRFPSLFGSRGFPQPIGNFRSGAPTFRQTGFPPRLTRRLTRFPTLPTSGLNPLGIPSFRRQFRSSRFSPRSFAGLRDFNPLRGQIGRFGRFSSRLNPIRSPVRRRIPPLPTGPRARVPLRYYERQNLPRSMLRGGAVSSGIISQLQQRFGRTSGRGTRDDPIRIPASFSSISGALSRGVRPQLRQGIRQPLQRVSGPQNRRVQLSRTRQPSQPKRQEEVIALLSFDQPQAGGSSGLPILSETIDKQVQVQRTPIKKSTTSKSKSADVSRKAIERKATKSLEVTQPITDTFLEKLDIHQLEKLANEIVPATSKTESSQATQHVGILKETMIHSPVLDVTSLSETKHVAQVSEKQIVSSLVKTADTKTASKEASVKTSIGAIIADADNVNINVNATSNSTADIGLTGNDIANTAGVNSISFTDTASSSQHVISNIGVPVPVKHIEKTAPDSHVSDYTESKVTSPIQTIAIEPAGIAVIADKTVSSETIVQVATDSFAESIVPLETTFTSATDVTVESAPDTIVPVEIAPTSEIVVPAISVSSDLSVPVESAPTPDISVPAESTSLVEGASSEIVVPVETVQTVDVIVPVESTSTAEITVPLEKASTDIGIPVEIATTSDIIVPVESTSTAEIKVPIETVFSEIIVPIETVSASDVFVPVESTSPADRVSSEIIVPAETAQTADVIVPMESTSTAEIKVPIETVSSEIIVPVEIATTSDTIVPVESTSTAEIKVPVEKVSADIIVPVESTSTAEIVVPVEKVSLDTIVPVESSPLSEVTLTVETLTSTEVNVPVDSVSTSEIIVPTDSVASIAETLVPVESKLPVESDVLIETSPSSEIIIPVETASAEHVITTLENVVPAEKVISLETVIPTERAAAAVVHTEAISPDIKQKSHPVTSKAIFHSQAAVLETKNKVLS